MKTYKDEPTPNDAIAMRRNDLGLTQRELSNKLGLSNANFITILEKGRSQVPPERVPDLVRALEMDGKWFAEFVLRTRWPDFADLIFKK